MEKKNESKDYKVFIIDDVKYKTTLTQKFEKRVPYKFPNDSLIYSFIPGTIVKIFVTEGEIVKEGGRLLTLEAMKMKNNITVPFDGKILKIHVVEGQTIPKKFLMVEMELMAEIPETIKQKGSIDEVE
ncbi:MAG: acetyl-CoA carboxylase biotin carboxyl carrier protein subunit [Bacteroidetes bacterium HGW-Bacteroidetes-21]|jgi:biotin carboxyl carrier protein|nr:MAG: acetyl-CoA carboxylase biotin carboxyl carrier protein subunit [Bacteroidetes bacterium HGW-Bacteroidetes-21]